ncbi:MAG: exodeoxyribonuclease VII large subunit [Bdellovibrionales bacterium]|nr:exodeoxyribonuclease VII large subunit [Bdellovibrionales bacterium]
MKKVSQIVGEIKDLLEHEFTNISIEGEVSNLSLSSSGHWYFTLSDKDSSLSAALFKMDALRNPQIRMMKDGAKVVVVGDINVYPKRGTFQVIVKRIVPVGVGDLKEQFEKLKRKLASEGLFDLESKKPIPAMPKRVAIITAQRGAALQDFINIYKRRSIWMDLLVIPTLVQGDDAPRAIRSSLHRVIEYSMKMELEGHADKKIDLIVLARGGGSLEDLWAFNDEGLAYDIFNCPIPLISAIGHEVDFSISDFVADLRSETPSAAAEVITHQQTMIKDKITNVRSRLKNVMGYKLSRFENRLKRADPHSVLNMILRNLSNLQRRLTKCDIRKRLHELTNIHEFYLELDESLARMQQAFSDRIKEWHHQMDKSRDVLKVLNPKNVLERGYGYLETEKGKVVSNTLDFDKLPQSASLNLHFHDGIRKVKPNEV